MILKFHNEVVNMKNTKFIGENLKNARIYRKMTITELSEKINVTKQTISQYERGSIYPESTNLINLSTVLKVPTEYFYTNIYDNKQETTVYFRALLKANKKDLAAQPIKLIFLNKIYEALKTKINFPVLNIPNNIEFPKTLNDEKAEITEIEEITQELRNFWGLNNDPIEDFQYTLEKNGLLVIPADVYSNSIDAYSQGKLIIVSRRNQSYARVLFDMAHELGHFLLHPTTENLDTISTEEFKTYERQANMFAGAFLLPREEFIRDISKYKIDLHYYCYLKENKWKVSVQAMIFRAHQLEILSFNQYQYLMKQVSKNGWRNGEPGDTEYITKKNILRKAILLLIEKKSYMGPDIMNLLRDNEVSLEPNEIEDLLSLDPGTLKFPDRIKEDIIFIK